MYTQMLGIQDLNTQLGKMTHLSTGNDLASIAA